MMKKNKYHIKILLIILIILSRPMVVDANREYTATIVTSEDNPDGTPATEADWTSEGDGCGRSMCTINRYYSAWSYIHINTYDMNGNNIPFDGSQSFLAGTYVGLNIEEERGFYSWASYTYSYQEKQYTCNLWDNCCYATDEDGKCIFWERCIVDTKTETCGCSGGYVGGEYEWIDATGDSSACKASAQPYSISWDEPSFDIEYMDSNDIEAGTTEKIVTGECVELDYDDKDYQDATSKKSYGCQYSYNREKVCMNVLNGKVTYIKNDETCGDDEYEIPEAVGDDGKTYWKYFIPLNATSYTDISLSLIGKQKIFSEMCNAFIEQNEDYAEIIVSVDDKEGKLPDARETNNSIEKEKIIQQAKDAVKNGCYLQTLITIPIEQKFYNEQSDGKTFKGFNFYYKPIDINNPFPNGLDNTSIWYDWSKNDTKNPDLTESYSEITYTALNINAGKVRNYNQDNKYTSWEKMTYEGLSTFIENEGVVTRMTDENNIYALGCGPANENQYLDEAKNKKNPLYQKECDNS